VIAASSGADYAFWLGMLVSTGIGLALALIVLAVMKGWYR